MAREQDRFFQGTLDMLVLKSLNRNGAMHGFALVRFIQQTSKDALRVEEGSLYPALHRLELEGCIIPEWGHAETGHRAKYYKLTARGRRRSEAEESRWLRMVQAIGLVLNA